MVLAPFRCRGWVTVTVAYLCCVVAVTILLPFINTCCQCCTGGLAAAQINLSLFVYGGGLPSKLSMHSLGQAWRVVIIVDGTVQLATHRIPSISMYKEVWSTQQ